MGKLDKGRCGLCCSLIVRLSDEDINRIMTLGFSQDFFTHKKSNGDIVLKDVNGYCRFVEIKDGIAKCTIYETRPHVCKDYVCVNEGEDDCKLKRHYRIIDMDKII